MQAEQIFAYKHPTSSIERQPQSFVDAQAYLVQRGISGQDLQEIGGRIIPFDSLLQIYKYKSLENQNRFAVCFPHYDYSNNLIDWLSARIVGDLRGFAAQTDRKKGWGKTFCPPKQQLHAWLHPKCDWLNADDMVIDVHESVVKAMLGYKLTHRHSMGLNGVACGHTKKGLVAELAKLPTEKVKEIRIIFDSNARTNWEVQRAQNDLASALIERGLYVTIHNVPQAADESEQDINEMWKNQGEDETRAWLFAEGEEAKPTGRLAELIKMNTECVLVRSTSEICELETGYTMLSTNFKSVNYRHRRLMVPTQKGTLKELRIPDEWLAWEDRRTVKEMKFDPTQPPFVEGEFVNLYRDSFIKEAEGSCEPLLELINRQINDEAVYNQFLDTLAWNVQHPGDPPSTYIVLVSTRGRTGKTLLLEGIYKPIFGQWGRKIRRDDLTARFNPWTLATYVFMEEVFASSRRDQMTKESNLLKDISTAESITYEQKNKAQYEVRKCFLMAFTSNNMDCLALGEYDRKAFVVGYGETNPAPQAMVENVARNWLPNNGPNIFLRYLRSRDLTGFDPRSDAPQTRERQLMVELARDAIEQFVVELKSEWQAILGHDCPYITPEELGVVFCVRSGEEASRGLTRQIGRKLTVAGVPSYGMVKIEGKPLRIYDLGCGKKVSTDEIRKVRIARKPAGSKF